MSTKGASVTAKLGADANKMQSNVDISPRTIDRWIFEYELRQRRKKELQKYVFYSSMIAMAVMVILIPEFHWVLKVIGELVLAVIAFMVWAIDNAKEMDEDPHPSRDEEIMEEEFRRRKK